ncbi:MAG: anion permease, partial [Arcobacteraceae bacterium]|nr:anion permease [Arcobacteraceae bacterium]
MDIKTIKTMEQVTLDNAVGGYGRVVIAFLFIALVFLYSTMSNSGLENNTFLIIGAVFGAYMAMNIGANDVANNVGPAVGSKALTMGGAIVIAAVFEAAGALIAGGDVVKTIKKGIIDIAAFGGNTDSFIWAMMAALLAAALWLNFATMAKAPVSTTHSIVGGVMGAGIAAAGFSIVAWGTMGKIAASWVISPVLGGIIAAAFLYSIKKSIVFKDDKISAAKTYVPIFVAIMSWAFVTYLTLKGLKKIWPDIVEFLNMIPFVAIEMTKKPTFLTALILGAIVALGVYTFVKAKLTSDKTVLKNTRASVNTLFTIPL